MFFKGSLLAGAFFIIAVLEPGVEPASSSGSVNAENMFPLFINELLSKLES